MNEFIDRSIYVNKPILLNGRSLNDPLAVRWDENGSAHFSVLDTKWAITRDNQHDHVGFSFDALLANIQPGTTYESLVTQENAAYQDALEDARNVGLPIPAKYGDLYFFPHIHRLGLLAPTSIRHLALLARNEFQIQDKAQLLTWDEQREIFGRQVFGVIGASVASLAAIRVVQTLKPGAIDFLNPSNNKGGGLKIGDLDVYNPAVWSRRIHGFLEVGENKAVATIRQLHEIDPSLPAWVYPEGIDPYGNVQEFINGDINTNEPPITIAIEAIDAIEEKYELLKQLRDNQVDTWRITDIGVAHQIDHLPFHIFPNFPLALGTSDDKLEHSLERARRNPSRENWFNFALLLTGKHWRNVPEFRDFIEERTRSPFSRAIPQLGIASEAAASEVAKGIASSLVGGWDWPHRMFIDSRGWKFVREWLDPSSGKIRRFPIR